MDIGKSTGNDEQIVLLFRFMPSLGEFVPEKYFFLVYYFICNVSIIIKIFFMVQNRKTKNKKANRSVEKETYDNNFD